MQGTVQVYPPVSGAGYTLVNSIIPTANTLNYVRLPFSTNVATEMWFEGRFPYDVGGTIFGGSGGTDSNDYRFFASGQYAYIDIGEYRIRTRTTGIRQNARSVHTWNHGFDITVTGGTIVTATGSTLPQEKVPAFPIVLAIGRITTKSFKVAEGNNVLFDGHAAIRDADGYLGLLDSVSGEFFLPDFQEGLTYD